MYIFTQSINSICMYPHKAKVIPYRIYAKNNASISGIQHVDGFCIDSIFISHGNLNI